MRATRIVARLMEDNPSMMLVFPRHRSYKAMLWELPTQA